MRISSKQYFTGTAFRDAFNRQEVGVHDLLTTEGELFEYAWATQRDSTKANLGLHPGWPEEPRQSWRPSPSIVRDMSAIGSQAEGKRGNFGLLYRMPTK